MPEDTSATTDVNPMDSLDFENDSENIQEQVETQTTTETPSSEENKEETAQPNEETEGKSEKPEEDKTEEESEEPEETEQDEEQKPKNSANNRIRSLANENRQLKQQIEQLNAQFYKPQTAEELQEQGMDETQSKIEALRQEQMIEKANNQIAALNSDINTESVQLMNDFQIFNPDSKEYDQGFHEFVNAQYTAVAGLQTDPNTNLITQARVLPYDFYKSFAEAREQGLKKGEIRGQRNYEKTARATDVTPSASPKDEKKDPLMESLLAD